MLDLRLEYMGGGQFQTRTKLDFELAAQELTQGETLRCKLTKQRSIKANRLFHGIIEAAFDNRRGGPGPEIVPTWRHLKAWVLCEIGHCEITVFEADAITPPVARTLRKTLDNVFFSARRETGEIVMRVAKQTRNLSSQDFAELIDKTLTVICNVIVPGADPLALRREAQQRMGIGEPC